MDFIRIAQQAMGHLAHGRLPPKDLTSLFISKSLGVGILAGACITKLPQVLAIVRSRSVEGISMLSIEMELYCNLVHVCYGWFNSLAVTAYGEAGVILLQNLALLGFIYLLKRASILRPVAMLTVAALVLFPVALEQLSAATMTTLYDMNSTIFVASKLPQIRKAFQEGKTGQLSIITTALMFAGTLVRIFTSMREGAGSAMVRGFMLGAAVNGIMLFQILYYGPNGRGKVAKAAKKKE